MVCWSCIICMVSIKTGVIYYVIHSMKNNPIISTLEHLKYGMREVPGSFPKSHTCIGTQKCYKMIQASEIGKLILVMGSK